MERGRLITIEGLDGAGKTTLAAALADDLAGRGVDVRLLREPGGVEVAERIRSLLADPDLSIGSRAEALLFAAARAELADEALEPMLAGGSWVLLDRFVDSSLAYQGGGRALGLEPVRSINEFATAGLRPDRTLYLRVDPGVGRGRQEDRGGAAERLEQEGEGFFSAVAAVYDRLAEEEPDRIRVIDASAPPDAVRAGALEALADLLGGAVRPAADALTD